MTMVPRSSKLIAILLVGASAITSSTLGYDGSMMNNLNILPSYTDYFSLTTVTLALNTSSVWIGGALAGLFYGRVTDIIGRRQALLWAAVLTIFAAILQAASQNIPMFVVARILIGFGTGASGIAGPVYLAETLPYQWRSWGLGIFYDFWHVGGLLAAGITYGTKNMDSTWAWRLPSALQCIFSILCIIILPFIPESPRWLVHRGRLDEALEIVALTHADGDATSPIVLVQYQEIVDTLTFEREAGETLSMSQIVKTPSSRKRVLLALSVAIFTACSGNNIASYYLGTMLSNAGIANTTTKLEISICLQAWCLVISLIGTSCVNRIGRKKLATISTILLIIFIFMIGGLTARFGTSGNTSGIYGTVASIFLFQGSYNFGWTPLTVLYPPEVLNFPIRANGMAVYTFFANGFGLLTTFAFPIALVAIGWKTYMINGAWDFFELAFVLLFWVETNGKTVEEIDELFDGTKHSHVPDLETMILGKADFEIVVNSVEAPTAMKSHSETVVSSKDK